MTPHPDPTSTVREAAPKGAKCCGMSYPYGAWRPSPCGKTAKVLDGGRPYCGTHDPQKARDREAAWQEKWAARTATSNAARAQADAERAVLDAAVAWHHDENPEHTAALSWAVSNLVALRGGE